MARYTEPEISTDRIHDDGPSFDITRTEIVGTVHLSTMGKDSPVSVAFGIIASYLNENLRWDGDTEISFTVPEGHTFTINATPARQ